MIDYTTILSGALIDYNDWIIRQNGVMAGAPNELRGIFYNKLITRLKEVHDSVDLRSAIKPEHMSISIISPGYINRLSFAKERQAFTPTLRNQILDGLDRALLEIDVTDYQDKVSYELSKVILDLKKSLNHGRQQQTSGD